MTIFLSFLQAKKRHPIASYGFWEYYIKNGIEESGHSWIEERSVDWAEGLVPQTEEAFNLWKVKTWTKTVDYIRKNKPDVFLSYLYPEQIDIGAIAEIRALGVKCVNFYCDHIRHFKKIPKEFSVFDLNWVPEYNALAMYEHAGLPYLHLPMPMWVSPNLRDLPGKETNTICFIGSKDSERQLFFESVLKVKAINGLEIFGAGWSAQQTVPNSQKPSPAKTVANQISFIRKWGVKAYLNKLSRPSGLPDQSDRLKTAARHQPVQEEYINLTRESKVTIGINRYPDFRYPLNKPNTYSRLRDIEAPMLGACYLTEWAEGLDCLYEPGREIETFKDAEEFHEKLSQLRKDKSLRVSLRKNGQQKALTEHSIPNTLTRIMNRLYA